jgi:iron-sulfur cluster repair protein YtfE (RIC family)
MRTIDPTLSVNDIIAAFPAALRPLSARGIDTCCRGNQSLAHAAAAIGVAPEVLIGEIVSAEGTGADTISCACGCSPQPLKGN